MEVARKVVEVTKFLNIKKRVENTTRIVIFLTNFELSKHGTKSVSTMSLALELSSVLIVDLPFSVLTQKPLRHERESETTWISAEVRRQAQARWRYVISNVMLNVYVWRQYSTSQPLLEPWGERCLTTLTTAAKKTVEGKYSNEVPLPSRDFPVHPCWNDTFALWRDLFLAGLR